MLRPWECPPAPVIGGRLCWVLHQYPRLPLPGPDTSSPPHGLSERRPRKAEVRHPHVGLARLELHLLPLVAEAAVALRDLVQLGLQVAFQAGDAVVAALRRRLLRRVDLRLELDLFQRLGFLALLVRGLFTPLQEVSP